MRIYCAICLIVLLGGYSQADERQLEFNRDILPILSDKCYHCHGPDSATREAELRFDVENSAKSDRGGYVVINPGDSERSELVTRINTHDLDLVMPPDNSERSLSAGEKETLTRWIKQGAKWQAHWAFEAPQRPALPQVVEKSWPNNAIDFFILKRLEAVGLHPSRDASSETWLRRVTIDLTGLPPTLAEVDGFLADESADAHGRVVDRLLASPRYGEHMAVAWLDAARYADTDGYQNDGPRTMYRWRDWVIGAYNANMPFDQFTIEQLAGDLLPDATLEQKIATGFNRNHRYNSEAGLIPEEFLLENAVDRVDTTSTVWMGLTIGCGRCHDHKYDPLSQREYYQLISFFDNISESGRAVKFGNSEPWVIAPTAEQHASLQQLDAQLVECMAKQDEIRALCTEEIRGLKQRLFMSARLDTLEDEKPIVSRGLKHHFLLDDLKTEGIEVEAGEPLLVEGFRGKSAQLGGSDVFALGKVGKVQTQQRCSIAFWLKPEDVEQGVILSRQTRRTTRSGLAVEMHDGHLQFSIIERWRSGVGSVETRNRLKPGEWVHTTLTSDGSQSTRGMDIWINGQRAETNTLYNTNSNVGGTAEGSILRLGGGVRGQKFSGQLDELRFYERTLLDDEIESIAEPASLAEIAGTADSNLTAAMNRKLLAWLLEHSDSVSELGVSTDRRSNRGAALQPFPSLVEVSNQILDLRYQRIALLDSFPTSMVMEEWPTAKKTHVRIRGAYDQLADRVSSDVPAAFPAMARDLPANRLGLARWLVSGEHPLTARVAVNRYWQRYFGTGLVKTAEDFGQQGELPSHPQLLDWLAIEFVESGWNIRAIHRLIVLSASYRQSSQLTPELTQRDPENRMLARGPRQRLSARILRDQALFLAGLLTTNIGGPSVSPYQPAKLWSEMSNMTYKQSTGKDLYRRGLYTIWKRTVAPPSLAILDAADRESCAVRPKRTNTPLQALTLLNETSFVEAAKHLAVRVLREGEAAPIEFAFRLATSRRPTQRETDHLIAARDAYLRQFRAKPERAKQLLETGESPVPEDSDVAVLAATTMLCNVLLNLDEVLTKE